MQLLYQAKSSERATTRAKPALTFARWKVKLGISSLSLQFNYSPSLQIPYSLLFLCVCVCVYMYTCGEYTHTHSHLHFLIKCFDNQRTIKLLNVTEAREKCVFFLSFYFGASRSVNFFFYIFYNFIRL